MIENIIEQIKSAEEKSKEIIESSKDEEEKIQNDLNSTRSLKEIYVKI